MSAVDPHKYKSTHCLEAGQLYPLVYSRFKDSGSGHGISVQGMLENVHCGWVKEDDASQPIGSLLKRGRSVFCQAEGNSDARRKVDAASEGAASEIQTGRILWWARPAAADDNIVDLGSDSASTAAASPSDPGDSGSSDAGMSANSVPLELGGALDSIAESNRAGSFAHFAPFSDCRFRDPEIRIDGIGRIPVPLTEEYAQKLIGACRQAPFGKGSETFVDESVRKTWEMDPTAFSFGCEGWVDGVYSDVRHEVKEVVSGYRWVLTFNLVHKH